MTGSETETVIAALHLDEVGHFADINASAPDLAAALNRRYGCTISVVGLDRQGARAALPAPDLAAYRARLQALGVPPDDIDSAPPPRRYDVIATLDGFGARHRIAALGPFLDQALHADSRLVLDVKKGSGSYPFLARYGNCTTLSPATRDAPGRVVMAVEPAATPAAEWADIARGLAGPGGFFTDCGQHSFLFIPRGDTLVVTFDNLDIALTKRETRRPWGFGFIEKNGWSMLGVMAGGWTWFRDGAVSAEFDRLAASGFFARFSRVIFYGASMGGYGAAAFSAAAPGATVFAISPQSTLDRAVTPWETRYRKAWERDFSGPYGDAALASRTAAAVHILYDPYVALDAAHAERFTGPNVHKWRCPLMGHRLGSSLQQMGILQDIATAAIEGRLEGAMLYRLLRRRRTFPRYLRELANLALERGHPGLALRVCDIALAQGDDTAFHRLRAHIEGRLSPKG
ncbi:hypothetical protein [Rhodovulum marinum]|uniref:Uncharacterized protein n=1 Tax=Rhodovulum marinum TaxID=320662 RepID=A0A4R2Q610_9RHOB|nr:hypothetical protein [Rhodovulum marinum]TCP44252.1 hypothetical protein EV662_101344 [Rhodovulum marinum]